MAGKLSSSLLPSVPKPPPSSFLALLFPSASEGNSRRRNRSVSSRRGCGGDDGGRRSGRRKARTHLMSATRSPKKATTATAGKGNEHLIVVWLFRHGRRWHRASFEIRKKKKS